MFTKKGAVEHEQMVYGAIAIVIIFIVGIGYLSFSTGETATKFKGELKSTTSDIVTQFKEVFGLKGSAIEKSYGDPAENAKKAFDEFVSAVEGVMKEPDKMKVISLGKLNLLKEDYEIHVQNVKERKVLVFFLFDKFQNKIIKQKNIKNDLGVGFGFFEGRRDDFFGHFVEFFEYDLRIYFDKQQLKLLFAYNDYVGKIRGAYNLGYVFGTYEGKTIRHLGLIGF